MATATLRRIHSMELKDVAHGSTAAPSTRRIHSMELKVYNDITALHDILDEEMNPFNGIERVYIVLPVGHESLDENPFNGIERR